MLVAGFASAAFGTNVYVVAAHTGAECVIIDPGVDVLDRVDDIVQQHRLQPVAVLLTHGHLDHTFSVLPLTAGRDVPAYIHADDRVLLRDPLAGLDAQMRAVVGGALGQLPLREPDDVRLLDDAQTLDIAGLQVRVDHAPGHTPGSVMFLMPGAPDAPGGPASDFQAASQTLVCGDVLFAGAIGRTDLPGGSMPTMLRTLKSRVLPLADDVLVLPGHGGATTIGRERSSNPFLTGLADTSAGAAAR